MGKRKHPEKPDAELPESPASQSNPPKSYSVEDILEDINNRPAQDLAESLLKDLNPDATPQAEQNSPESLDANISDAEPAQPYSPEPYSIEDILEDIKNRPKQAAPESLLKFLNPEA